MPVSKQILEGASIKKEAAEALGILESNIFILPKTDVRTARTRAANGMTVRSKSARKKPVIAIWTRGLSEDKIKDIYVRMQSFRETLKSRGYKYYVTKVSPDQAEAKEHRRRKASKDRAKK